MTSRSPLPTVTFSLKGMPRRVNSLRVLPTESMRTTDAVAGVFRSMTDTLKESRWRTPPSNANAALNSKPPAFFGAANATGTSARSPTPTVTTPLFRMSPRADFQRTFCARRRSLRMTSVFLIVSPGAASRTTILPPASVL